MLADNKIPFEIKDNGDVVKANMTNQAIEVPNTSLNDSNVINVIGVVVTLLGIAYLIYDKVKKK